MNEEILWMWARFSLAALGRIVPVNFIEDETDELVVGFECVDGAEPMKCLNGRVVRRIALSFPYDKKEIKWH